MGTPLGGRLPWKRWWTANDRPLHLFDGMLPDPAEPPGKYVNRGLQPLLASDEYRARILLAEPGMGKSYELQAEAERLNIAGSVVARLDLVEYLDVGGLRDAFRKIVAHWTRSEKPELVLALDSFDEPLAFGIVHLGDIIKQELEDLDKNRLRLLVASRASYWSTRLESTFEAWWGTAQVVRLTLAPLTRGDIALAASTAGLDPVGFLDSVAQRGVGPFAARPDTLKLLLAASATGDLTGDLPSTRTELYARGVAALAAEPEASRRSERRLDGVPAKGRVLAARRLAAITLLSGQRVVIRRISPGRSTRDVALDAITGGEISQDMLDAVYDSALLTGGADGRTWIHHSLEEYLAARQLADLPLATAISLLTVPGKPDRLIPQLRETAAWLAWLSPQAFAWLLRTSPQVLTGPDLQAASDDTKAAVAKAVVSELRQDVPMGRWQTYGSLAFTGLADLLLPLLDDTEPAWRRREALAIIAATRERGLDPRLVDIVERAAQNETSSDETAASLAEMALVALHDCSDIDVHHRLTTLLGDSHTPVLVRASIIDILWPAVISTTELVSLVAVHERFADPYLRRRSASIFTAAIEAGQITAHELIEWYTAVPTDVLHDDTTARLGARAAYEAIQTQPVNSPRWKAGIDLARRMRTLLFEHDYWSAADVHGLEDTDRRLAAREILRGGQDILLAATLQARDMIRKSDLPWWLDQLANDLQHADQDSGISARMVVERLLTTSDHEWAANIGRAAAQRHPVIAVTVDELLAPDSSETRHTTRMETTPRRHQLPAPAQEDDPPFDLAAFTTAIQANDFTAALRTLQREDAAGASFWLQDAWAYLGETHRDEFAHAALSFLSSTHDDHTDLGWLAVRAHEVLLKHKPVAVAQIPPSAWLELLPHLLTAPGNYRVLPTAVTAAGTCNSESTASFIVQQLDIRTDPQARIAGQIGSFRHPAVGQRALELLAQPDLEPRTIGALLWLALTMGNQDHAFEVARNLIHRLQRPLSSSTAPDDNRTTEWPRVVEAIAAVMASDKAAQLFDDIRDAFEHTSTLFAAVARTRPGRIRDFLENLTSDQLADLYLWTREHFPPKPRRPGATIVGDAVEDRADDMLNILRRRKDLGAATAIRKIATVTSSVWLRQEADDLRDELLSTRLATPQELTALLAAPSKRLLRNHADLADVILDTLDKIGRDLPNHSELLWDRIPGTKRRSRDTETPDTWRPKPEAGLSAYLAHELTLRLANQNIVINREVLVQPRNAYGAGDKPDILVQAISSVGDSSLNPQADVFSVAMEVKPVWRDDLDTAQETQLARRYLPGAHTDSGIYVVATFPIQLWTTPGDRRKSKAAKVSREILDGLADQANQINEELGLHITTFVLNIPRPHAVLASA